MFGESCKSVSPIVWWKSLIIEDSEWPNKVEFLSLCAQLFSAVAATASLERMFSTLGMTQSKLRNRLGNEKAGKLSFIFKYKNQNTQMNGSLEWLVEQTPALVPDEPTPVELESDDDIPLSTYVS